MDIFNDYKNMSFAQLRDYLKKLRTKQKTWYAIPAVISVIMIFDYGFHGWTRYPKMVSEMSMHFITVDFSTFGIVDWIISLLLVPLLPYEKTTIKYKYASCILYTAYVVLKILFGVFNPINAAMALYFFLAAFCLTPIHKEINFIKGLPDYPFPEHVETERKREAEARKYSETNATNQMLIKKEQEKKAASMDELMGKLPKRVIDPTKISRGEFDEIESEYTDKLIGEDLKAGHTNPDFEEINEDYKGMQLTQNKLTMERRERIDEIDDGFEADFTVEQKPRFSDDGYGEEDDPALPDGKVELEKRE